jgi:hypothetical protein
MKQDANILKHDGHPELFTFWKGRVALYAILKALNLGPGDAVFMPGYTCQVVPSAVIFLGAKPVYADVEEKSYNLSLETLEASWRKNNGILPKAVIIQHTYGIPVEAGPIIAWARSEGLSIIEDCAHILGSSYRGIPCGQLGDAAFFSSQWGGGLWQILQIWLSGCARWQQALRNRTWEKPPGWHCNIMLTACFFALNYTGLSCPSTGF